jgi:hypothetical protein
MVKEQALVNLNTGRIFGAKPNTFEYFHEEGHMIYNNTPKGMKESNSQYMTFYLGTIISLLGIFVKHFLLGIPGIVGDMILLFGICGVITSMVFFAKEEMWCNQYARKKVKAFKELKNLTKFMKEVK